MKWRNSLFERGIAKPGIRFHFAEGDASGGGGGAPNPPAGDGVTDPNTGQAAPAVMTSEAVSKVVSDALTAAMPRFFSSYLKRTQEITKKMIDDSVGTRKNDGSGAVDGGGGDDGGGGGGQGKENNTQTQDSLERSALNRELRKNQERVQDLENKLDGERTKQIETRKRSAIKDAMGAAGVLSGLQPSLLSHLLLTQKIEVSEDGDVFTTSKGADGIEDTVPLVTWMKDFVTTENGQAYLPARNPAGAAGGGGSIDGRSGSSALRTEDISDVGKLVMDRDKRRQTMRGLAPHIQKVMSAGSYVG